MFLYVFLKQISVMLTRGGGSLDVYASSWWSRKVECDELDEDICVYMIFQDYTKSPNMSMVSPKQTKKSRKTPRWHPKQRQNDTQMIPKLR